MEQIQQLDFIHLAVVLLDNASHYTFRHLTIATDSTSYGVKFSNNSTNNIIENCDFQEGRPNVTFVHIENTDNTTNQGIVRNNTFFGGADAIILRGTAQNPSSGSQVINNYLNFHTFRGIAVDTAKDTYIADNVITRSMEGLMITNLQKRR